MTQSSKRGDFVVKFTGVYDETGFRAVIGEIVSRPPGIQWVPESFTLWFYDEGKNATYRCLTGGDYYYEADLTARSAQTTLATPNARPPEDSWDRPHIYLHISDESQRNLAMKLREGLLKSGYTVMGIQNASGNEGIPTQSSELRFFTPNDSAEAQRIAKEVAPFFGNNGIFADLPEAMPHVSHARQYEIWFSSAFH